VLIKGTEIKFKQFMLYKMEISRRQFMKLAGMVVAAVTGLPAVAKAASGKTNVPIYACPMGKGVDVYAYARAAILSSNHPTNSAFRYLKKWDEDVNSTLGSGAKRRSAFLGPSEYRAASGRRRR